MRGQGGEGGAAAGLGVDAEGAQPLAEPGCGERAAGQQAGEQPGAGGRGADAEVMALVAGQCGQQGGQWFGDVHVVSWWPKRRNTCSVRWVIWSVVIAVMRESCWP